MSATIDEALQIIRKRIAPLWPLHSFVATNPLGGLTDETFEDAVDMAVADPLLGAVGPVTAHLTDRSALASAGDVILIKWLEQYCTADQVTWQPPFPMDDFLKFARAYAAVDPAVADTTPFAGDLSAAEIIDDAVQLSPGRDPVEVLSAQLDALPGWAGYVLALSDDPTHPERITIEQVCAVRLLLATALDEPLLEESAPAGDGGRTLLAPIEEGESSLRELLHAAATSRSHQDSPSEAALCFCIDARSEPLRRALEDRGPYTTYGVPGFFGLPVSSRSPVHGSQLACPPLFTDLSRMSRRTQDGVGTPRRWLQQLQDILQSLEHGIVTAYSTVESRGWVDALWLSVKTLSPAWGPDLSHGGGPPAEIELEMDHSTAIMHISQLFEQIGLDTTVPIICFVGHESRSRNNAHASTLDCGACGGHSGVANARALANLCNDGEIRAGLRSAGVDLPDTTTFVAARHETTTDTVEIIDPPTGSRTIGALQDVLAEASTVVARSRAGGVNHAVARSQDPAQPRPEWGLARNGGMIVGPRRFSRGTDLDGRVFLQSYAHGDDPEGTVLASLLTGPVQVAHWINAQYLFSTLLPAQLGAGSKLYHNPLAGIGVRRACFGDLQRGLPQQSTHLPSGEPYHEPIRLQVLIIAPPDIVTAALAAAPHIAGLYTRGWLRIDVLNPSTPTRIQPAQLPVDTPSTGMGT